LSYTPAILTHTSAAATVFDIIQLELKRINLQRFPRIPQHPQDLFYQAFCFLVSGYLPIDSDWLQKWIFEHTLTYAHLEEDSVSQRM
jgi:hypothetical protein